MNTTCKQLLLSERSKSLVYPILLKVSVIDFHDVVFVSIPDSNGPS